jgi:hypothetical protein
MIIDNLSKFGFAILIKDKKGPTVKNAFHQFLLKYKRKPDILGTDAGKEFTNREFQDLMQVLNIKHLIFYDDTHAVLIERWIKTIKEKINKYMTHNNTKRFIDVLPQFIMNYNRSIHSRTKYRPIDVTQENSNDVYKNLYKMHTTQEISKFEIGDKVRVALSKNAFTRGFTPTYSNEIYTIKEIYNTSPYLKYQIVDYDGIRIRGSFYSTQLIKV